MKVMVRYFAALLWISLVTSTLYGKDLPFTLADLAHYLSGKALKSSSPLSQRTQIPYYAGFKRQMDQFFEHFKNKTLDPIADWRERWLPKEKQAFCFYPFAGGDFINAYAFFPKAKTYLLIGLEKAGKIPNILQMAPGTLSQGLSMMVAGYQVFIHHNFYRTRGMAVHMDQSPLTGTIAHILSQMGWLGLKPLAAFEVSVNSKNRLTFKALKDDRLCEAIALDFIDSDGTRKRVIYARLDLSNYSLQKAHRWRQYLSSLGPVSGLLKAASHLPQYPGFTIIRDICLAIMSTLVQDDTGLPFVSVNKRYHTTLFGKYSGPHPLFPEHPQPQLRLVYQKGRPEALLFKFGYERYHGVGNLLLGIAK